MIPDEEIVWCATCGMPMLEIEAIRPFPGRQDVAFCSAQCIELYHPYHEVVA